MQWGHTQLLVQGSLVRHGKDARYLLHLSHDAIFEAERRTGVPTHLRGPHARSVRRHDRLPKRKFVKEQCNSAIISGSELVSRGSRRSERRRKAYVLDLFTYDVRIAMQEILPHPFIELLTMTHRQGSFDQATRELT
jgi:hypothetical protein